MLLGMARHGQKTCLCAYSLSMPTAAFISVLVGILLTGDLSKWRNSKLAKRR